MKHNAITSATILKMNAPNFAKRSKPILPSNAPTLVTAFTCGGLFEIGAMYAGFRPVLGVEFYPAKGKKDDKVKQRQSAAAADNYERNFGTHIIRQSIEDAVRDRVFVSYRPNAFHCSPSCTNLSQGNTKGSEDDGDVSAATAITQAIAQLGYPEIFTLENVEAYQKSESWLIICNFLYANGYGVSADVVWASDYGNLETGEGVPQDRKRFIVRAVRNHFAPPLPLKVSNGWDGTVQSQT
jgi:site-specific DNA-cytosine methylase